MRHDLELESNALRLLEQALALPEDQQRDFLIAQTAHDTALKHRVLSLWQAEGTGHNAPATGMGLDLVESLTRPSKIGSFQILDELGSGGMGSVYLGQKISDDFDFIAAIKVVKRDSLSDDLVTRLISERRTLANLRHPNIAHFYDGGETEQGHPFFAMEYVKGEKLFDYIDRHKVSSVACLSIFKDVCTAVAFAHQNLVIHRDLTPSNILVSEEGIAKLIDFGIAHSLREDNTQNSSLKTGTQGYIAPEKLQGAPPSTITDVYSLGIILSEILQKVRLPRMEDIRAIAEKAAHDKPEYRYQSADALIQDLIRYENGQAVGAIHQSWWYLTKRYFGRHRLLVGSMASVFVVSVLATILISVSYFRVQEAEEQSRHRFNEVRELAHFMMFDLYDEVEKLDTSLAAREILIETTLNYLDRLSELPQAPQALQVELALGYQRMADISGGTGSINLGERAKAENLYLEAIRQIDSAYSVDPSSPEIIRAYAKIHRNVGTFEWVSNLDFPQAKDQFSDAKKALQTLLKSEDASIDDRVMDGALALGLSQSARNMSEHEEAVAWAPKRHTDSR